MSTELVFSPIERSASLTRKTAERLESLILDARLASGDKLPSERELAVRFGVSRTVIREAVREAAAKGLVEVRAGSGTFIRGYSTGEAAKALSVWIRAAGARINMDAHLIQEAREALEVSVAEHAAERASPEDLRRLREVFEKMADPATPQAEAIEADIEFHRTLAACTHNDLFPVLLDSISEVMLRVRWLGMVVPGGMANAIYHHRIILEKVEQHDMEGARCAMGAHMTDSQRFLRQGIEMEKGTEDHP